MSTTEQKIVFSCPEGAKITKANMKILDHGKSVEIVITTEGAMEQRNNSVVPENFDEAFPIIDPSELIGHELLNFKPITRRQEELMSNIRKGIKEELPAFRAPYIDPSEENGKIVFKPGNRPAVGHSALWWDKMWEKFMPEKNSRSGTELHRAAFLGKQMKYLIDKKKYSVESAWEAVCNDSRGLGHYWNSKDAKHDFEPTGSRKVGAFYDLANTCKLLKKYDGSGFLLAGGRCNDSDGNGCPLADMCTIHDPDNVSNHSVGWLVLDV